jgi:hypothetical protein
MVQCTLMWQRARAMSVKQTEVDCYGAWNGTISLYHKDKAHPRSAESMCLGGSRHRRSPSGTPRRGCCKLHVRDRTIRIHVQLVLSKELLTSLETWIHERVTLDWSNLYVAPFSHRVTTLRRNDQLFEHTTTRWMDIGKTVHGNNRGTAEPTLSGDTLRVCCVYWSRYFSGCHSSGST